MAISLSGEKKTQNIRVELLRIIFNIGYIFSDQFNISQ